jgi:hypothetical protein
MNSKLKLSQRAWDEVWSFIRKLPRALLSPDLVFVSASPEIVWACYAAYPSEAREAVK